MSVIFSYLLIPFLLSMFLAINMGGSGTAPAFSAAYGANVIRRDLIPGLFGIGVFAGAILAGKQVSLTLGTGILSPESFTIAVTSAVLLSIGLALLFANLLGIPQSTSQATVLAIAGAAGHLGGLDTKKLFLEIIPTWFIMPVIAFVIMFFLARFIFPLIRRLVELSDFGHLSEHPILKFFLIGSCMYVAFSIGANNVANAAGPIASMTMLELGVEPSGSNYLLLMILSVLIVAPCFAIGSSLFGRRTTHATGKEIVKVSPFTATVIACLTATLLIAVSVIKGIPTSLVQLNTGAFIAYSIVQKGLRGTFSNKKVKLFIGVWAIAPLFAYFLSYLMVMGMDMIDWL